MGGPSCFAIDMTVKGKVAHAGGHARVHRRVDLQQPCIEMGVVGIGARLEHSTDEHIHVEDMERAIAMMVEILRLSA
jgi:di/tripeptidase